MVPCVRSLLAQDYPGFEVLALYDGDIEDGTGNLLHALADIMFKPSKKVSSGCCFQD